MPNRLLLAATWPSRSWFWAFISAMALDISHSRENWIMYLASAMDSGARAFNPSAVNSTARRVSIPKRVRPLSSTNPTTVKSAVPPLGLVM